MVSRVEGARGRVSIPFDRSIDRRRRGSGGAVHARRTCSPACSPHTQAYLEGRGGGQKASAHEGALEGGDHGFCRSLFGGGGAGRFGSVRGSSSSDSFRSQQHICKPAATTLETQAWQEIPPPTRAWTTSSATQATHLTGSWPRQARAPITSCKKSKQARPKEKQKEDAPVRADNVRLARCRQTRSPPLWAAEPRHQTMVTRFTRAASSEFSRPCYSASPQPPTTTLTLHPTQTQRSEP